MITAPFTVRQTDTHAGVARAKEVAPMVSNMCMTSTEVGPRALAPNFWAAAAAYVPVTANTADLRGTHVSKQIQKFNPRTWDTHPDVGQV